MDSGTEETKVPELSVEEMDAQNALLRQAINDAKTQNAEHLDRSHDAIQRERLRVEGERLRQELLVQQNTAVNQGNVLTGLAAMQAAAAAQGETTTSPIHEELQASADEAESAEVNETEHVDSATMSESMSIAKIDVPMLPVPGVNS